MARLLWIGIPLLGLGLLLGYYFNNPMPPSLEEPWFMNFHVGLISMTIDVVSRFCWLNQ